MTASRRWDGCGAPGRGHEPAWDRHTAETGEPGVGRWSAGRRRPLRHWGCASRVAGPAGHARGARAGPFAKDLPREPRKLPWGLANPWRLPALHHLASAGNGKRGWAYPAPEK